MKQSQDSENDEEEVSPGKPKQSKRKRIDDDDESKKITRGRMGIMLPEKNAFELIERVDPRDVNVKEKKKDAESGKAKL